MLDTSIQVKTENFDGPLGLLLMLVQREEMDVRELDLTTITKQYLSYLEHMRELNFDVAGEYLYLASTLLLLKSKNCITEEEVSRLQEQTEGGEELQITSEAELIRRLEELQKFQKLGEKLWGLPKKGHEVFVKPKVKRKEIANSVLTPIELDKLITAMMDFIQKQKRRYQVVRRDRLSIKEKLKFLQNNLSLGTKTTLDELVKFHGDLSIDNIVITFISLLEMARLKRIDIYQNEGSRQIYAEVVRSLEDFDVDAATGFEEENDEGGEEVSEEDLMVEADGEDESVEQTENKTEEIANKGESEGPEMLH